MDDHEKVLSFDLGAKTGWVVLNKDLSYISGGTTEHKIKSGENKAQRWINFRSWIRLMLEEHSPDVVFVENVSRHKGVHAAHAYGFYRNCLEAECLERGISLVGLSVGEWKKLSTGRGNSKKHEVAEAILNHYPGIIFESDDHSDALGIGYAGVKKLYHN